MSAAIHFRGSMLFCRSKVGQDWRLDRILLPDGQDRPSEGTGSGTGMEHLDKRKAALHYQGLLVDPRPHERFDDARITIGDASSGVKPQCALGHLPQLSSDVWELDNNHSRSTIEVFGNATVTTNYTANTARTFSFLEQRVVHDQVTITFPGDVPIAGIETTPITVRDGEHAFIYNFDTPLPKLEDLTLGTYTNQEILVDDDFKWVYSLLKVRGGTKSKKKGTGAFLPAPVSVRPGGIRGRSIYVSTCFPGVYPED